jgi:hypothetical protein
MPNKVQEMNAWKEYQEHLKNEMDKQATSTKALLWVGIAVNGVFTLIALTVAIVALINALMCGRDNLSVQKELGECRINHAEVIKIAEKALDRAEQNYYTEAKHASEIRKRIKEYHE